VILLVEPAIVTRRNEFKSAQFPGSLCFAKPNLAKSPRSDPAKDPITVKVLAGAKHSPFLQGESQAAKERLSTAAYC
jgi:hypothetical protein